jgi:hypothetical protein
LVDFLCDVYDSKGVADHQQLKKMDYCTCLTNKLAHHDITDEQVIAFVMDYRGHLNLEHIASDPIDLKLVVFVKDNDLSVFLTCDAKLLQLSKELGLKHWCLKAAIHQLSESLGGIFGESEYEFEQMFAEKGEHPFFHYAKNTRCSQCHDNCQTHKSPPIFTQLRN